jgi:hypothetical protein
MSTDNNNTQAINKQLIAVLRPVLHSLPLEVVKAAIPAEAKSAKITDEAGAKWVKETAPDQVLGLMGWPSPGDMFSKEELIGYVRRFWSTEIFEPEEFIPLVHWYITIKGVSVHDIFEKASINDTFHEDDICEFIGDLEMHEVAQHMPEWKLVEWIKESHLTKQALGLLEEELKRRDLELDIEPTRKEK